MGSSPSFEAEALDVCESPCPSTLGQPIRIHPVQVIAGGAMLDPYTLTIGFARRFATYKRAYLIFRDFDRLLRIITDEQRPVQIVFAGKAHPADEPGKLIIQQVYRAVKDAKTGGRLAFPGRLRYECCPPYGTGCGYLVEYAAPSQ